MALSYPDDTIWYVRATSTYGNELSEGSAVAVRLQKRSEPQSAKTYLLTCGHVLRGRASDGTPGFGRVLPNIRVWAPGVAFNDTEAVRATIAKTIKDVPTGELPLDERDNAVDDWAVLEIEDPGAAVAAPAVREWAEVNTSGPFRIWGYPAGEASLLKGVVIPTPTPQTFPLRDEFHGVLRLSGDGTRPGISGGGVFAETTRAFAGLHRARHDDALQLHAVMSIHIRARLFEFDFEVSVGLPAGTAETSAAPPRPPTPPSHSGGGDPRWTVDELPIDWSRPEPKVLEKLLVANVPPDMMFYHAENVGIPLAVINANAPPMQRWREILKAASRAKRLRLLVESLVDDPQYEGIADQLRSFL